MRLSLHFLGILLLSLACLSAGAESQRKLTSYQKYISKYSDLAIQHQKKYRIPASITLAQGLLESGAGQSDLARRSSVSNAIRTGEAAGSITTTTCGESASGNTNE